MKRCSLLIALVALAMMAFACGDDGGSGDSDAMVQPGTDSGTPAIDAGVADAAPPDAMRTELDERVVNYGEALRTASLKLTGAQPELDDILAIRDAADDAARKVLYDGFIDNMVETAGFTRQMIALWRNILRMRLSLVGTGPSHETAPTFAARLVVSGSDFTTLFTATSNTCPTYNDKPNTFTDGDCNNNVTPSGLLTDPGIHDVYWGNLALRTVRYFHETFLCRSALEPRAEPGATSSTVGPCSGAQSPGYDSPWDEDSITGRCNSSRVGESMWAVEFHAATGNGACGNCHGTFNHRAPLFARFNEDGIYSVSEFEVFMPIDGEPRALATDFLPAGEPAAYKFGSTATTIAELGTLMANDPEVQSCLVKRMWNFGMSHGDIVTDGAVVPDSVVADLVADFQNDSFNLKNVLRAVFKHEDFVRF